MGDTYSPGRCDRDDVVSMKTELAPISCLVAALILAFVLGAVAVSIL